MFLVSEVIFVSWLRGTEKTDKLWQPPSLACKQRACRFSRAVDSSGPRFPAQGFGVAGRPNHLRNRPPRPGRVVSLLRQACSAFARAASASASLRLTAASDSLAFCASAFACSTSAVARWPPPLLSLRPLLHRLAYAGPTLPMLWQFEPPPLPARLHFSLHCLLFSGPPFPNWPNRLGWLVVPSASKVKMHGLVVSFP